MWLDVEPDAQSDHERVCRALDLAAARLATSFGSGWHLLPETGEVSVSTRAGTASIGRDSLRSAVRGLYTSLVEPGTIEALCALSLDEAESLVREGGTVSLTEDRLERLASVWSYLSPGRVSLDEMVKAGGTLRALHSHPVRESFLTNAAWEAHGCLMAVLGGGSLPARYSLFLFEADIGSKPISIPADHAIVLRNDCLELPDYGREIEAVLRLKETV
ncbi:hypothetical protein [Rhizobium sp. BK176]|uniref:hypothetical protein n=1 Tax=Rhizobium sp. BK176 TaxID=2587071 RepID=UPI00216A482B|nr:hypothetical protein [Rhizobium sp. BK176]MCS4089387.1 hypothetical protein [Rhizobium sp. BK176]